MRKKLIIQAALGDLYEKYKSICNQDATDSIIAPHGWVKTMLKIGKTYYLKTWEELKKASNGDYSGALDFGEILFLSRMKILCGDKICIIGKYPYHEGVYQGIDMKISQQFLFTENMLFTSGLRKMIEVRNESRTKV